MFQSTGFSAFKYREYRVFWIAAAFSNVGIWALIFGRLWLMHTLTDSQFMLGLVTFANLGPILLFSVWGGVMADRVNRLILVRITRGCFAILALITAVLIFTETIEPWIVIFLAVVEGLLLSFDIPARGAMVATIVPKQHLASAIALYSIVFGVGSVIGPSCFAPIVKIWGLQGLFFIVSAAYFATTISLMFMTPVGHRVETRLVNPIQGLKEGFSYLLQNRPILGIILIGIFGGLVGFSYQTLIPVFADKIFLGGETTYGRLLFGSGIGGLAATIFIIFAGSNIRPAVFLVISGILYGFFLVVFSRTETLALAVVVLGFVGAARTIHQTMSQTLIQTNVLEEYRGRMMGINQFTWGSSAFGGLLMGFLGQYFGAPFALTLGGLAVVLVISIVAISVLKSMLLTETGIPNRKLPHV